MTYVYTENSGVHSYDFMNRAFKMQVMKLWPVFHTSGFLFKIQVFCFSKKQNVMKGKYF